MTRAEMIKVIAEKTGFTQKDIRTVLTAQQEVVLDTLPKEEVKLMDGVTLTSIMREARMARNPQTGEAVEVPAHLSPKCKFGKAVKEVLK